MAQSTTQGTLYAIGCYFLWGVFPIYFRALAPLPPVEIVLYRIIWAMVFLALVLGLRRQWDWLSRAFSTPGLVARYALSALLLSTNWLVYIWACNSGHVIDASLGYFINPLVNVLLAYFVLRERLRSGQWLAIVLAALGVVWLTVEAGQLPWVGLTLALSFGLYGLLRKTAPLGALEGLALETLVLFPFALLGIVWMAWPAEAAPLREATLSKGWLLLAAGPITAVPLLMYAAASRRISFSLLGMLQYLCPSLQLALGALWYDEPFSSARAVGYGAIWLALLAYSAEALWQARRQSVRVAGALRAASSGLS